MCVFDSVSYTSHMCPCRDHGKATQQRFGSLRVSGNIWKDLKVMRQGVEIETTAMARRRLLMNYEWFPELLLQLPDTVKENYYCKKLLLHLAELADYMCSVGPWKMSKKKLSQVLAMCRPWELHNPDISSAVQVSGCHLTHESVWPASYHCSFSLLSS